VDMQILNPVIIIGCLGLLLGLGLSIASRLFAVKVDPRVAKVRDALPGANCGACGQTGCDQFAECLVEGSCPVTGCPVGGNELVENLSSILGVEAEEVECTVARILCNGSNEKAKHKFNYHGLQDCTAASLLHSGPLTCPFGCVGMGSCKEVCPFDAIIVVDGLARIVESKCTGCGNCIKACPKGIIELIPVSANYTVRCSNKDKGNLSMKACKVSCIGCRKCAKVCPADAITVENFLATINPDKCTNCGQCVDECPTKAINVYKNQIEKK
jgi:electron transport complex protein RnfB